MPTVYVIDTKGAAMPRGLAVPILYDDRTTTPAEVSQAHLQLMEMLKEKDPEAPQNYARAIGGSQEVALPDSKEVLPGRTLPEGNLIALPREDGRGEIGVLVRGENLHAFVDLEGERHPVALRYSERGEVAVALPPEVYTRLTGNEAKEPVVVNLDAERLGVQEETLKTIARHLSNEVRLREELEQGALSQEVLDYLKVRERIGVEEAGKQTVEITRQILENLEAELVPPGENPKAGRFLISPEEFPVRQEAGTIVDDRGNREGYYLLEIAPDGKVEKVVISSGELGDVARAEWYGESQQRMAQETAQTLRYSGREEEVAEKIHPSVGEEQQERLRQAQAHLGGLTPPEKDEEPEI